MTSKRLLRPDRTSSGAGSEFSLPVRSAGTPATYFSAACVVRTSIFSRITEVLRQAPPRGSLASGHVTTPPQPPFPPLCRYPPVTKETSPFPLTCRDICDLPPPFVIPFLFRISSSPLPLLSLPRSPHYRSIFWD